MIQMMPCLFHQAPICKKVRCYLILHFGTTHTRCSFFPSGQRARPVRATTGGRLAAALAAEKLDEYGNPIQSHRQRVTQPLKPRAIAKHKRAIVDDAEMDVEDEDFVGSSMEDESDNDTDVMEISNKEVSNI
jgi:hypothetical protein